MKRLFFTIVILVIAGVNVAFAQTYDFSQISQVKLVSEYSPETSVEYIDAVFFGEYPQLDPLGNTKEPLEWLVLNRQDNRALLISKYVIDHQKYNSTLDDVTWETCTLRNWLNTTFLITAFNSSDQNYIQTTNVINSGNPKYGTSGGNNTIDKVFCLSIDEVKMYFNVTDMFTEYQKLITIPTFYAAGHKYDNYDRNTSKNWVRLRSPGRRQQHGAFVTPHGNINYDGYEVSHRGGIRPALWVTYK